MKSFNEFILENNSYPSKTFSDNFGIELYREWKMPRNRESLNERMPSLNPNKRKPDEQFHILWRDFVLLNPQIEKWVEENENEDLQKWNIMFGMVSMFNEDDILSYLKIKGFNQTEEFKNRLENVKHALDIYALGWIPSEKTLQKIESFIENREK